MTGRYVPQPRQHVERDNQILALLREGKTMRAAAQMLGVTKGIVIGVRNRYGKDICLTEKRPPKRTNLPALVRGGGKQLEALGARDCRYPYGDPGSPSFVFCARPRDGSSPYCAHHRVVCTHTRGAEAEAA